MITVCIQTQHDGQYKVWTEAEEATESPEASYSSAAPQTDPAAPAMATPPEAPEAPEDAEDAAESAGQVVKSLKEALTLAMEALKSGGQMSDMNGQQKAFQDGFGQGAV